MKKEKKEKQLDFGLKNSPKNIYYKYKDQYELWLAGLETKKFMKDPLTWFSLIFSSTFIAIQMYLIESTKKIPTEIPIFNYFINPSRRIASDEYIYMLPMVCLLVLISTMILSNRYYHKERDLSKVITIIAVLVNLSICLVFLKLFLTF